MSFKADFNIDNDGVFVNEKSLFKNTSSLGLVIDSNFLQIDGDVKKEELDLSNYIINNISKIQWSFSDGVFYSTDTVVHKFFESKNEFVKLTVWSDAFTHQGKTFYFTHSVIKEVQIQSRFYKFIKDNYPLYDDVTSPEFEDLIKSAGKFFDRMHADTSGLLKLIDIHKIDAQYLEYWALTLGHSEYTKKVGYVLSENNFDNYDIFDRIRLNIASEKEINALRNFILYSAELFRNKGTSQNIINFLKFFDVDGKIKELWTKTWNVLLKDSIEESFNGYENFEDNKLKLKWQNINITNINNSECYLEKKFNSILMNSFNVNEKIEYPLHEVSSVTISGSKFGWKEFELSNINDIKASPSIIISLLKENGSPLVEESNGDISELYDIVSNIPVRYDENKYSILQISDKIISDGDRINVLYDLPKTDKKSCIVSNVSDKVKDFDLRISFKIKQENTKTNLFRTPDNSIFVSFRGIKNQLDFNSDFDDFYKFTVNTDRKTFSLDKIIYSNIVNDYLTQHISLGFNNDEVFEPVIFYPSSSKTPDEIFEFEKEKEYELLVMVNGLTLSAYIREKENENKVLESVSNFEGNNNIKGIQEVEWIPIIENFSFDVQPKKIKTVDINGNEIYSEKYTINKDAGYYGFGISDGIIEFTNIILNNLDVDDKLYNQVEKELELKPKYLENLEYYETRSDNYKDTQKTFLKNISNDFKVNTSYELSKEETTSLNTLFLDKSPITQDIGTRYIVEFNDEWIKSNFSSNEDVVNKILLPFGNQRSWIIPEQKIIDNNNYSITGSESFMSIASGSPGFFSADLSPILNTYQTEPFDNFSSTSRENIDSLTLTFNDKLNQYISYNSKNFTLSGVWEEVYPLSSYFENIESQKILDDSSIHVNKMFAPITVDIPEGLRVIGVKFKSCDYIKNVISRYSTEFNKEVTLWGSFTFHVPCGTVINKPSDYILQSSTKFPSHYQITIFTPLGILNEGVLNYSLSREFILQTNNSPSLIDFNGVYAKLIPEKLIINNNSITLKTANPFESVEKGLKVNHYISANIVLASNIEVPKVLDETTLSNTFTLDINNRNFFDSLKNEDDFRWWIPTEVWRIRNFDLQQVNLDEDIVSGVNYISKEFEENNTSKIFYGKEIPTSNDNIKSLNIKLTDGTITPNTIYYAKIKVKIQYSGFSTKHIEYLTESDRNNVKIGGNKYTSDLEMAPVNVCKELYLPIAWYDINELSVDNPNYDKCSTNPSVSAQVILSDTIEFGNYLRKTFGGEETVTLSPLGLMTDAINNKPLSNVNILLNIEDVARYVSKSTWDHNSWNKYFIENLEIVSIYEKVPSSNYKLFNKYLIFANSKINTGSNLEFIYNDSELSWDVLKNFSYFITNYLNKDLTFEIPYELQDIYKWNTDIKNVYLNRYIIDNSLYAVGDTTVSIKTDPFLEKLQGGKLNGIFNFDLYFDKEKMFKTVDDDFNNNRQINWIPYESNSSEIYENMKRIPSKNLLLGIPTSNTESYDIIVKDNIYAFRSLNKNSIYPFEGRQSGTKTNNRSVNITQNEPNARRIFMIDNDNFIFDIKADVYFDAKLNEIKNYRGKKFEIILKAEETFEPLLGKNILGNYYFAGIGSYDFDVAMGLSSFNKDTSKNESSFLAGFGDYNTRNIKSNTWYTIRCIVTNDYIRVLFNPKGEPERLVMNYFINEKYQQDTSRYLSGNFEELVYNITGLDKLNIIYPDKAGENTNEKFVRKFINNELIPKVRPSGSLCGFRIYNEYTYMTNVHYKYLSEDGYKVGNAFDVYNLTDMVNDINKKY